MKIAFNGVLIMSTEFYWNVVIGGKYQANIDELNCYQTCIGCASFNILIMTHNL